MRKLLLLIALFAGTAHAQFPNGTPTNPVGANLIVQDAGSCSTTGSYLWQKLPNNALTTTVNLSGTFSGTVTVRESNNGGGSWTAAGTQTAVGTSTYSTNGFTDICADVTTYTSGSIAITITTGTGGPNAQFSVGASGVTLVASNPATCTSGSSFFNTTTGQSFVCSATNTLSQVGVPGVVNVKFFGAVGNAQESNVGVVNGTTTVTCANCAFTVADQGKLGNATTTLGVGPAFIAGTTISTRNSATNVTMSNAASNSFTGLFVWGTEDSTAILAAATAWYALLKNMVPQSDNYLGAGPQPPPTLYFPASNYLVCNIPNGLINPTSASFGGKILGDGLQVSIITICGSPVAVPNSSGVLLNTGGNNGGLTVQGLTFNNALALNSGNEATILNAGSTNVFRDIICERSQNNCINTSASNALFENVEANGSNVNFVCQGCTNTVFRDGGASNGNVNLEVIGGVGEGNNGGVKFSHNFWDECGTPPCARFINTNDFFSTAETYMGITTAISVDLNSYIHLAGDVVGPFGNDNNTTGMTIALGGTVESNDTQFNSSGTGKSINNLGNFLDNGNNASQNQFPVASATSTGTTAVITVSQNAPNGLCSVGDSLLVTGMNPAGYNGYFKAGITAVSATTITYLTQGASIGAAGAGGFAYCRNLQNYAGTLPIALLNNPVPNTCYVTGTFGATVTGAPMCAFKAQSFTNITNIKAASTTVTACTVAPVVTISDGTNSATLTLTTAKSLWDSSVDTSTGVGTTIFKPNYAGVQSTIQVTNTAGTCTTPPTNFSISYNISPILSN